MTANEFRATLGALKEKHAAGDLSADQLDADLQRLAAERAVSPPDAPDAPGDLYDRLGAAVAAGLRAFVNYGREG